MQARKAGSVVSEGRAGMLAELLSPGRLRLVAGFALCQTWNVLCVALPKPVTYGEPFMDLRWLSMLAAAVA